MLREIHTGLMTPICYIIIALLMIGNAFMLIHHSVAIVAIATAVLYLGAMKSLEFFTTVKAAVDENKKEPVTVSMNETWSFPLVGSLVLLSIHLVLKYVGVDKTNLLFLIYFSYIGGTSMMNLIEPFLLEFKGMKKYNEKHIIKNRKLFGEIINLTVLDIIAFAIGSIVVIHYGITKHWISNDIIGISFVIVGLQKMYIGKYKHGALMLVGLFLYDIFWVFGTDVMVEVAKKIEAPLLLKFKRVDMVPGKEYAMLGLGDIIVPGIFISLLLRFEVMRYIQKEKESNKESPLCDVVPASISQVKTPIFNSLLMSYLVGLIGTIAVMVWFNRAQPALLYLVPVCLITSIIAAAAKGQLQSMLIFDEEKEGRTMFTKVKAQ